MKRLLLVLWTAALTAGAAFGQLPYRIGVDPGHGGSDPGAVAGGLSEKDVNLATALALKTYLERDGATVFITRTADTTATLASRSNYFISNGVARAVSVHHNCCGSTKRTMDFVSCGRCATTAADLAGKIIRRVGTSTGLALGPPASTSNVLCSSGTWSCPQQGVGEANLHMVREPEISAAHIPAVLVEVSFISDPDERLKLADPAYVDGNGWALYAGLADHYGVTPKPVGGDAPCVDVGFGVLDGGSGLEISPNPEGVAVVNAGQSLSFEANSNPTAFASYDWDFGDGTPHGAGAAASHTYLSGGISPIVTLAVPANGACRAGAQRTLTVLPTSESPRWFVPGVAYLPGAIGGTLWQTDLTVLNPDPVRPAAFSVALLDGRTPLDPKDLVWTSSLALGPRGSLSASNVLEVLGQPLGSYGALLVRGDVTSAAPVITSRTFNNGNPAKGTFGLSVPTTPASGGVSRQSSAAQRLLIGLRDDDTAYTNIGLVNLVPTDWSRVHLTFFDALGANLGLLDVSVPPYGVTQLTRPLTGAAGLPKRDLFGVEVAVDADGSVSPYATVIDNTSTDAVVVTPLHPSATYRVPGIVRAPGANGTLWRSRFFVHNPSRAARTVNLLYSWVPCDAAGCRERSTRAQDVPLAAGETKSWDDFPSAWLAEPGGTLPDGVSYGSSYIDVKPATGDANPEALLVLGETYNSQPTGPVGLQLPGFTDLDAASREGAARRLLLAGLASNEAYRTNVAFFLTSGSACSFGVHVFSGAGAELKTLEWTLSPSNPFVQFSDAFLFADLANRSDRMSVIADSFDGSPVAAYATIIDNTSGDATFVRATPAP